MQRLERDGEFIRPDLEPPGVGRDRGDLRRVQPIGRRERESRRVAAGVLTPALAARPASRPVRTSTMSPRPTRADGPCASMVAARCSWVMANPSGSSPASPTTRPTSSRTPRPTIESATVSIPVTASPSAGDDLAGPTPVPCDAVVEDVSEPVPLGRALQWHRDDVVRTAEPVRKALDARFGVGPGVEHRVHRVGAAPPALLRAVHVEALRQGERERHDGRAERRLSRSCGSDEVHRSLDVVGSPAAPVREPLRRGRDGALGVVRVELARSSHLREGVGDPVRDEVAHERQVVQSDVLGAALGRREDAQA